MMSHDVILRAGCISLCVFAVMFFIAPQSVRAAFNMADLMCNPVKMECGCMQVMGPKGCKGGPNMYKCPCFDVTSGFKTSGTCEAPMKCKGTDVGGMPPMLPMIPMMMPMMMMPSDPCMAGGGMDPTVNRVGTTSTSTPANPCPSYGGFDQSQYGSSIFDTSYFDASSDAATDSLYKSLNSDEGGVKTVNNASSTTAPTAPPAPAPLTPTTSSSLSGIVRIGNAGGTIVANLRQGLTEVAGFFGGNAIGNVAAQSAVSRICAARPWSGNGFIANLMPDGFFDSLCTRGGYQLGVVTPQNTAAPIRVLPPRTTGTTTRPRGTNTIPPEADIWAEPESVRLGTRTYIFWNSRGVVDCKATGPNFFQNALSGGASTVPISGATTFKVECTAPDGTKVSDSVTVNLAL